MFISADYLCLISFWTEYIWIISISYFFPCSIIFLKLKRRKKRHYLKTKQKTKNLKKALLYMCVSESQLYYNCIIATTAFCEWPLENDHCVIRNFWSWSLILCWELRWGVSYHRSAKFIKIVLQKLSGICICKESEISHLPFIMCYLQTWRQCVSSLEPSDLGGTFGERRLTCRFPSHHPHTENK